MFLQPLALLTQGSGQKDGFKALGVRRWPQVYAAGWHERGILDGLGCAQAGGESTHGNFAQGRLHGYGATFGADETQRLLGFFEDEKAYWPWRPCTLR